MRGKFKKEFELKSDKQYKLDIATVGDNVIYNMNDDGTGVISEILERKNYLSRKSPRIKGAGFRGERLEQVIAANLNNLFVVSSAEKPKFNNKMVDRILVAAESSHLNPIIVINKIDLDEKSKLENWIHLYEEIGYKVILTSCVENLGINELKNNLSGKISLLWGQSGVGKSSLLNLLYPELNLKVGEISGYSNKGKHTTVTASMIQVDTETFVIDTPGIREIDPYGIRKEDLGHYFIEFAPFINDCKFNTCTHHHEPGCAVIEAVESEKISVERYESYLFLLETIEEDILF